jgi:hypothetical protein
MTSHETPLVHKGLLGPPTKFTTVRSLPIKNALKKQLAVEKSSHVQDNFISYPLWEGAEASLRHALWLIYQ